MEPADAVDRWSMFEAAAAAARGRRFDELLRGEMIMEINKFCTGGAPRCDEASLKFL